MALIVCKRCKRKQLSENKSKGLCASCSAHFRYIHKNNCSACDYYKTKCNCVVGFHIGHNMINKSDATKEKMNDDCCGGVFKLKYCPLCGRKNK